MPCAVLNDCSIDLCSVDGLDDTPPPVETGAAAPLVFVGPGVTTVVAAGFGVFVGSGVAVGAGVFVGSGVAVGSGVFVGGIGVFVGMGVADGGTGVSVGGSVGTTVGAGSGVAALQPANNAIATTSIRKRRGTECILLLVRIGFPRVCSSPMITHLPAICPCRTFILYLRYYSQLMIGDLHADYVCRISGRSRRPR